MNGLKAKLIQHKIFCFNFAFQLLKIFSKVSPIYLLSQQSVNKMYRYYEWVDYKRYKPHFICADCRVGFKQRVDELGSAPKLDCKKCGAPMHQYTRTIYSCSKCLEPHNTYGRLRRREAPSCPHCHKQMIEVSVYFEIPRKNDIKAWKNIAMWREKNAGTGPQDRWYMSNEEYWFRERVRLAEKFKQKKVNPDGPKPKIKRQYYSRSWNK